MIVKRPPKLSRYVRASNDVPVEVNEMKLRSLIVRLVVAWIPVLPPAPLIAQLQREASPVRPAVHVAMTADER